MKIKEILELLQCGCLSENYDNDSDIIYVYASDLMSDILVLPCPGALLVTGLVNHQVVRTSKIAGVNVILFVRNKKPEPGVIDLSVKYKIPILTTKLSMFEACGLLYNHGLRSVHSKKD
ncbi:MAG: hypothetical protein APR63_07080 [Desulfuromonas sp. SDB]|nr:MAG: hypothetical protein APR63_07080 [Desulfuromonas sp. SDB]